MSYILDALRKADAQRQRDPARGIHAQPLGSVAAGPQARGARNVRLWSAAAIGVVALSSAGWYLYRGDAQGSAAHQDDIAARAAPVSLATVAQAQTSPVVGNDGVAPNAVAPAPAINPAPAMNPAPPVNPVPAPVINPPPAPVTSPPVAPPLPSAGPGGDPRAMTDPTLRRGRQPPASTVPGMLPGTPAQTGMPPGVPANTPAALPRMPAVSAPAPAAPPSAPVAGLPPDAPKLVLSGGVYSANPAQSMLIVNGQVFNEGSEVAPGITLEEVKARTVVLRFRGARYTVAY